MRNFMLGWIFGTVLVVGCVIWANPRPKPVVYEKIGQVELIAQDERGMKIYKVVDKKIVVPVVIVEAPNGQIAIR